MEIDGNIVSMSDEEKRYITYALREILTNPVPMSAAMRRSSESMLSRFEFHLRNGDARN